MRSLPSNPSSNLCTSGEAEAAILTTSETGAEALAVIYDQDDARPEITVTQEAQGVFTVLADGQPVAVVASALEAFSVRDVLVVERVGNGRSERDVKRI